MTSLGPSRRCRRANKENVCLFDSTGTNQLVCTSGTKSPWYKCCQLICSPPPRGPKFDSVRAFLSCFSFCLSSKSIDRRHFLTCFRLKSQLWVTALIYDVRFFFLFSWYFNSSQHLKPDGLIIILMFLIGLVILPKSILQCFANKTLQTWEKSPSRKLCDNNPGHTFVKLYTSAGILHVF